MDAPLLNANIKPRLIFALWGAVAGSCNPIWPLILPYFINRFNAGDDFVITTAADYVKIALSFELLFAFALLIPCFLSGFILFPWLQEKTKAATGLLKPVLFFGFIATGLSVLFLGAGQLLMMKSLLSSLVISGTFAPIAMPGLIALGAIYAKRWKNSGELISKAS